MIRKLHFAALLATLARASGCATTDTSSEFLADDVGSFSRFLIVGQAGDYNSRAEFERLVVSEIRARGASATAYHVAAGGNVPISRDSIREAVQGRNIDAVVLTRVINSDTDAQLRTASTETLASRRDNGLIDLFRYDYREVTGPSDLDLEISVTIVTEVYDVGDEALVWAAKSSVAPVETMAELINSAVNSVAGSLSRDNLIAD